MQLDHLPNECLKEIISCTPLPTQILHLRLVSHRWASLVRLSTHRIKCLTIVSPKYNQERGRFLLLPTFPYQYNAYHVLNNYSINPTPTTYRLELSSVIFPSTFLLDHFPNLTKLDLIYPQLESQLQPITQFLTRYKLTHLKLIYIPTSDGLQAHLMRNRFTVLHQFLHQISSSRQPNLVFFLLQTEECSNRSYKRYPIDLSQLTEFHLIKPHNCSNILDKIFSPHFQTTSRLQHLTCNTNVYHLTTNIISLSRSIFPHLTSLTLPCPNITILTAINYNAHQLQSLNLLYVQNVTLPEIALNLQNIRTNLTSLRIKFLNPKVTYEPIILPVKAWDINHPLAYYPAFPSLTTLRLSNSRLIHFEAIALPILGHLFPNLHYLTLDNNFSTSPPSILTLVNMNFNNCQHCKAHLMRLPKDSSVSECCKVNLVEYCKRFLRNFKKLAIMIEQPNDLNRFKYCHEVITMNDDEAEKCTIGG